MTANMPTGSPLNSNFEVFYEGALGMYSDPLMRSWKSLDDTVLSRLLNGIRRPHADSRSQQHHHDTANPDEFLVYEQYHSIRLQLVALFQRLNQSKYCQGPYTDLPSC